MSCKGCGGEGRLIIECCNGADGCSCHGGLVDVGSCRVCNGSGIQSESADSNANLRQLQGYAFAGSGPTVPGSMYQGASALFGRRINAV